MIDRQPSEIGQSVRLGRYRHFKGGEYDVLAVGRLSEQREQEVVIYRSITLGTVLVRPLEMFLEIVDRPDFSYHGPRFVYFESNKTKKISRRPAL